MLEDSHGSPKSVWAKCGGPSQVTVVMVHTRHRPRKTIIHQALHYSIMLNGMMNTHYYILYIPLIDNYKLI